MRSCSSDLLISISFIGCLISVANVCMVVYLPHNCRMTSYNIYANGIFYSSHTAFLTYIIRTVHNPIFKIFSCIFVCLICIKFHPFMKRMVGWNGFLYRCIINHPCLSETTGDSIPFEHAFQEVPYRRYAFSVPGNVIIQLNAVLLRLSMPT